MVGYQLRPAGIVARVVVRRAGGLWHLESCALAPAEPDLRVLETALPLPWESDALCCERCLDDTTRAR